MLCLQWWSTLSTVDNTCEAESALFTVVEYSVYSRQYLWSRQCSPYILLPRLSGCCQVVSSATKQPVSNQLHAGSRLQLPVTSSICRIRPFPFAAALLQWSVVRRDQVLWPALQSFKVKCSTHKLAPSLKLVVQPPWPSKL